MRFSDYKYENPAKVFILSLVDESMPWEFLARTSTESPPARAFWK
jgi:hypothetical protein